MLVSGPLPISAIVSRLSALLQIPAICLLVVVVVFIFRPVEPKARLPKGIGRPAACMAYLS